MQIKKVSLGKVNLYLLIAVLFIILAVIFYSKISADLSTHNSSIKKIEDIVQPSSNSQISTDKPIKVAAVEDLLDGLRARLETSPDDMQGWVLLAKSYHHTQRWADATEAFSRAKALGYSGDIPWSETSKETVPPNPFFNDNFLQEYFARQTATNKKNAIGKTQSVNEKEIVTHLVAVNLALSIDPALKAQLDPNSTVFIFAREFDALRSATSGPPLAALRMLVSDLPVNVSLSDQMAIVPGRTISSVEQLVIGARVSLSGDAIRQTGDFEKISAPIKPTFQDILPLVISQQVLDNRTS